MKKYKHEIWTIFKELRKKTHKKERYIRNVNYLHECLQCNCIPKGFNTKNKTTYIDEDLKKKYAELNNSAIKDYLLLLIDWVNSKITILNREIESWDSELKPVEENLFTQNYFIFYRMKRNELIRNQ